MKISLKNVGPIKESSIEIKGLTVIAGENDTGKSTVSKALYSIISAFNNFEMEYKEALNDALLDRLKTLYLVLRRNTRITTEEKMVRQFSPQGFLLRAIRPILEEREAGFEHYDKSVASNLKLLKENGVEESIFAKAESEYYEIKKLLLATFDEERAKKESLRRILANEFHGQICNNSASEYEISAEENQENIFHMTGNSEGEVLHASFEKLYYNDCIYLESPFVLYMNDLLNSGRSFFSSRSSDLPKHTEDLLNRLKSAKSGREAQQYVFDLLEGKDYYNLHNQIGEMIRGDMFFDTEETRFKYSRKDGKNEKDFDLFNVAAGIKSLGILQMLMKGKMLGDRCLIIIDEPEVHLHPKWQIEFAEVLVQLVSLTDSNVLINTHSPYFLNALQVYVEKYKLTGKEHFYLSQKQGDHTEIVDRTESINDIYKILFEPFQKLEDEKVDAETDEE